MSMYTSAGLYYSQYSVTPSANPTSLLVSTSTYSPVFAEKFQWVVGAKSKLYGTARLYYPLFSSDAVNGSSSAFTSFGGGLEGGWIQYFSKNIGANLGLEG